jgi:hypothetical protein
MNIYVKELTFSDDLQLILLPHFDHYFTQSSVSICDMI